MDWRKHDPGCTASSGQLLQIFKDQSTIICFFTQKKVPPLTVCQFFITTIARCTGNIPNMAATCDRACNKEQIRDCKYDLKPPV